MPHQEVYIVLKLLSSNYMLSSKLPYLYLWDVSFELPQNTFHITAGSRYHLKG